MGGVDAPLFDEFTTLFACGFHALQVNIERIVVLIEIMAEASRYPCFHNADKVRQIGQGSLVCATATPSPAIVHTPPPLPPPTKHST